VAGVQRRAQDGVDFVEQRGQIGIQIQDFWLRDTQGVATRRRRHNVLVRHLGYSRSCSPANQAAMASLASPQPTAIAGESNSMTTCSLSRED